MIGIAARSIPTRILAALLSIFLVTYFATAVVVYTGVRASLLESGRAALDQLADLKYRQLAAGIGTLATNLTAWSQLEVMNDLVSGDIDKRISQTLETLKRQYGLKGEIYAFDGAGKLIAGSDSDSANPPARVIPTQWEVGGKALVLLEKAVDPLRGGSIVAFVIPVFGKFDPNFRIGTLVLTEPWTEIEWPLFSLENGTVLWRKDDRPAILASDPAVLTGRVALPETPGAEFAVGSGLIAGRSRAQDGLIVDWQVVALQDVAQATRPLRRIAVELLLLGLFLAVPIVILGRWLSRRLTAPIAALTRVVREIADTDQLNARAPVTSSDELGSLARSFNRMTENLERAVAEREQFVRDLAALNQTLEAKVATRTEALEAAMRAQQRLIRDISHEIKSPLARLSMALGLARRAPETGRRRQFDRIEQEIETISALASELLTLARLDGAAAAPEFRELDMSALLGQIVADAIYEKPERADDVAVEEPDGAIKLVGNADLLRRAVENVIRNAIFYTVAGTEVAVTLARSPGDRIRIAVADRGPGVPDGALVHLFEPFYRVDEARARETGGSGIGLAICQRVVLLHGGTVRARNDAPHGLIVEIALPADGRAALNRD